LRSIRNRIFSICCFSLLFVNVASAASLIRGSFEATEDIAHVEVIAKIDYQTGAVQFVNADLNNEDAVVFNLVYVDGAIALVSSVEPVLATTPILYLQLSTQVTKTQQYVEPAFKPPKFSV